MIGIWKVHEGFKNDVHLKKRGEMGIKKKDMATDR